MINVEYIELDNEKYMIIKRKKIENQKYVLISNINNPKDFAIRKEIIENGQELVVELSSEEEFDKILPYFVDIKQKN